MQQDPVSSWARPKKRPELLLCRARVGILVVFVASGPSSGLWPPLTGPLFVLHDASCLVNTQPEEAEVFRRLQPKVIYAKSSAIAINIHDEFFWWPGNQRRRYRVFEKKRIQEQSEADRPLLQKSDGQITVETPLSLNIFPVFKLLEDGGSDSFCSSDGSNVHPWPEMKIVRPAFIFSLFCFNKAVWNVSKHFCFSVQMTGSIPFVQTGYL